jgi:hypothetical protein
MSNPILLAYAAITSGLDSSANQRNEDILQNNEIEFTI